MLPPSVETSTPPTTPPPLSDAVPDTVTGVPTLALLPDAGALIVAVGRGRVRAGRGRDQPGLERPRLRTHVRQQVHGRLLDVRIRRGARVLVHRIQAPGPLDGARAEHERAATSRGRA